MIYKTQNNPQGPVEERLGSAGKVGAAWGKPKFWGGVRAGGGLSCTSWFLAFDSWATCQHLTADSLAYGPLLCLNAEELRWGFIFRPGSASCSLRILLCSSNQDSGSAQLIHISSASLSKTPSQHY